MELKIQVSKSILSTLNQLYEMEQQNESLVELNKGYL